MDERKARVLQALVEEFIRTGQPVSSQAILERSGLDVSSATVRNELSRLEAAGYVTQPHPSAGRIPTQQGYRWYVDHCSPARLRTATRQRIESFFADVHQELSRLLKETSGLLADITHYPAVVIGPGLERDTIHGVHLVRLGGPVVLVVTVTDTGRVTQQLVTLGFEPTDQQLAEAEELIEAAYTGRSLSDAEEDDRLRRSDLPDLVRRIIEPVHATLQSSAGSTREVFVGGTSQLAQLWSDLAVVRRLLGLLERETDVVELLGGDQEGITVRFAPELGDDIDLAVVTSSFEAGGHGTGRVGVLGPMRMDYRRTIRVVEEVGEGLEERLGG